MNIFKKFSIHFILLVLFILPVFAYGQATGGNPSTNISIPNPARGAGNDLLSVITTLLREVVLPIAAVLVVLWIIWAGFTYLLAQGNPQKIKEAHQRLLWSLIGAGILLGAVSISAVVQTTIKALMTP